MKSRIADAVWLELAPLVRKKETEMADKKTSFVELDEPVTLASSTAAMIKTKEAGRVLGFGCDETAPKSAEFSSPRR